MNVSSGTVLDATRRMLAKHGSAVSLELIAAEAGLTRQTLYNRYGSKPDLLRAAFDELRNDVRVRLNSAPWNEEPEVLLPIIARIVADNFLDLEMAKLLRAMFQVVEEIPDIGASLKSEQTGQVLDKLTRYLEKKNSAGEFLVSNPRIQAMLFLGSISGFIFPRLLLGTITPEEVCNQELINESVITFLSFWRKG